MNRRAPDFRGLLLLACAAWAQPDVRLQLARQWEQEGELDRAAQELRMHVSEHPDDVEAYRWMGDLRWRLGKLPQAVESYRAGLKRDSGHAVLRERLALALENSARLARGELSTLPPDLATVSVGAPTRGASTGAGAAEEKPVSPPAPKEGDGSVSKVEAGIYALPEFQEALRQYGAGKKELAQKSLRRVLEKSPGHPGAYYLGGVIRYENGEYDKAEYNFKRAFNYPDKGFNAHFYLGRIHQRQGKAREAVAAYERYLQATQSETGRKQAQAAIEELKKKFKSTAVNPPPAPRRSGGSDTVAVKESVPPAQPKYSPPNPPGGGRDRVEDKAEPVGPDSKSLAYPLGDGLFFILAEPKGAGAEKLEAARGKLRGEKIEHAVQTLKAAQVEFAGTANADAVPLDLAAVYLQLGLWDQAATQAGDYVERRGGRFERYARYLKALALIGLGKGKDAESLLLTVRAGSGFGPPPGETAYHLARACEGPGDGKRQAGYLLEAEKGLRDAARLLWARQRLGGFWTGQGDHAKAAQSYRASLAPCADTALVEACAESSVRLADSEYRRKAAPEAQSAYEELLRRWPRHREAAWAQYQIGNLRKASGDWESALHAYQRVIDNYPGSYWAAQARWQREDAVWRKEYEGVLD